MTNSNDDRGESAAPDSKASPLALAPGSARLLDTLKFDLGEYVWLVGHPSYIIEPTTPIDYRTDAWRKVWHVSQKREQIVGLMLSGGKVYYQFRGGGNSIESHLFSDHADAAAFVTQQNIPR